jgi:hypothetical protein
MTQSSSGSADALLERANEIIAALLQWTSNWTVPFADEDEWLADKAVAKDFYQQVVVELRKRPGGAVR